jgi:serine/threonine protein kinase
MKIIKNRKAHHCQALIELRILEFLNNEVDKKDLHHIIRKYDHFYYKNHLCIVFELLNENLYELLKQNYFQGVSLNSIRFILKQILEAAYQLQKANLIHCDLKPENILLKIDKENPKNEIVIKITDFGSACFKHNTMFQYIQSRYYRSPEVILGVPYSLEIDMWSIGCIAAELYLGEPLLPGMCEYDQLFKIIQLIGEPPEYLIKQGRNANKYFIIDKDSKRVRIKTNEEYYAENVKDAQPKYSIPNGLTCLDDICKHKKINLNSSNNDINNDLESFVSLLKGLLNPDPKMRWNAQVALRHPFITREKYDGHFNPYHEEISIFHSLEGSYLSDLPRNSNKSCHSMIMNQYCGYNTSDSNFNNSIDVSCYQPNLANIPLKMLKKFPYAMIDKINLKPQNDNKFDANNKTFMMTSFDQLGTSFDMENIWKHKRRELKEPQDKFNKFNPYNQQFFRHANKKNTIDSSKTT